MSSPTRSLLAAALVAAFMLSAPSADAARKGKSQEPDRFEQEVMQTPTFLASHPDLDYRGKGWRALQAGEYAEALAHFRRAARFADKASQAMIAEMHFDGNGVPKDRALGYAWMDLAAERGYENFLVLRERYWKVLTEAEREDAVRRGEALYREFGDSVAQPRIATVIRRGRKNITGSRTGFVSAGLKIAIPGPGGSMQEIDGTKFYSSKFWDPKEYQAWHDTVWKETPKGRIDVGELEPVRSDAPPPKNDSRVRKDGNP